MIQNSLSPQLKSRIRSFSGSTMRVVNPTFVFSFTTSFVPYPIVFVLGSGSAGTTAGGGEAFDLCRFCLASDGPATKKMVPRATTNDRERFIEISPWLGFRGHLSSQTVRALVPFARCRMGC